MNNFNPERLQVEYRDGILATNPIVPRKHTLTHSDFTGQLFLTIGTAFACDKVNVDLRDEVLGEWKLQGDKLNYNVYVYLNKKEDDISTAIKRNEIFRRELPLALTAICYGDRVLFMIHPYLKDLPIVVNFLSTYPELYKQENWGNFHNFC